MNECQEGLEGAGMPQKRARCVLSSRKSVTNHAAAIGPSLANTSPGMDQCKNLFVIRSSGRASALRACFGALQYRGGCNRIPDQGFGRKESASDPCIVFGLFLAVFYPATRSTHPRGQTRPLHRRTWWWSAMPISAQGLSIHVGVQPGQFRAQHVCWKSPTSGLA